MSLPINTDNSIQSNFTFFTSNTYDGTATSNYVTNISNILNTNINTKQNTLNAATNLLGVGSAISALDYEKITLNKPTYFPIDPSIYYNQTQTNNLLNAKEQILTFNAPLTRTTNTININLGSYPTYTALNSCNYITNSTSGLVNYPSYTVLNSCNYITNATTGLQNYYNTTQINNISNLNSNFTTQTSNTLNTTINTTSNILNNAINTKQNILTTNTILLGYGSNITNIDYNKLSNLPTTFLTSNIASNIFVTQSNAIITSNTLNTTINTTSNTTFINYSNLNSSTSNILNTKIDISSNSLYISSNFTNYYNKTQSDGRYLQLVGGTITGNFNIEKSSPIVSIKSSTETQSSIIYLSTPLNITSGLKTAIIAEGLSAWGRSKLHFCLNDNQTDNSTTQNASVSHARMTILPTGYVGIGTTNPISRLTIRMSYNDGITGGFCIDSADAVNTYNLRILSYVQAANQVGYIFQVNNIASSVNAIILNYDGGVNINNYLRIKGRSIYNDLFNSSGFDHGTITDFNNITDFGYRFINAPATNGPGTPSNPASQYYTWLIGLGANYPYTQFSAQFALPRNIGNPVLSVRYRDASAWSGWTGITAEALTAGNKTISGNLTVNGEMYLKNDVWHRSAEGNQRFYFANGARSYYQGYGSLLTDYNHEWRNHVGTGVMLLSYGGSLLLAGEIVPTMTSVSSTNTDYCGVSFNSAFNGVYQTSIKILYGTFTGIHRCFTEDELYNKDEPQKFKDDYVGRIVVSTGKIATDSKTENDTEWNILYDKEGITIEDALPIIQLSRKKKDKRVFGVLGLPSRNNSRAERMIVNSIGEGAILVCNYNGNIENGDLITSSDYLGYGQLQDDDIIRNYTVGKATISCTFELDSPYYNCYEIDDLDINGNKLRVALIACVYYCG